jgi:putative membrane protein
MKLLILAVLSALPIAAFAADATPDLSFYKSLAEGGIAEVRDGKLAQAKGADQKIKDFGAMMVKDHSAANQELMALAQSKGIKLPSGPGMGADTTKAKLDVLSDLSGSAFDKSYVKGQIKAHRDTVALLQKEISTGQDAQAKAFAQKVLPTVQSHLDAIEAIATGMGIKS